MKYGKCHNCLEELNDLSSITTGISSIFKGNNYYVVCKNCRQVFLYNTDEASFRDLDKYKDNIEVIKDINYLLSKVTSNYEVEEPTTKQAEAKPARPTPRVKPCKACTEVEEDIKTKEEDKKSQETISTSLLAVNKENQSLTKILKEDELCSININELNNWSFYELVPVTVRATVNYEIMK